MDKRLIATGIDYGTGLAVVSILLLSENKYAKAFGATYIVFLLSKEAALNYLFTPDDPDAF